MNFIHTHNTNIELVNHALTAINHRYKIRHMVYIELFDNQNKAHILSNVSGVCERLHSLGKFSEDFYASIQKTETNLTRNFLWPANPRDEVGLSLKEHGLSNGFTIIQKGANSIQTWAYLGDKDDTNLADLFINEKQVLYDFIPHFQEEVINNIQLDCNNYMPFKCNSYTPSELQAVSTNVTSGKITRYYLNGKFSDIYITTREKICMSFLASGKTYKEIASSMSISINTVKKHVDAVKLKTGILRKSALIDILLKTGIL